MDLKDTALKMTKEEFLDAYKAASPEVQLEIRKMLGLE